MLETKNAFKTEAYLQKHGLNLPNKETTPLALPTVEETLTQKSNQSNQALMAYRIFYGLNEIIDSTWCKSYIQFRLPVTPYQIHVQIFEAKQAKQTCFVLHGYLEHSALYQPFYLQLLQQGCSIVTFDLPGHGLSTGRSANIVDFIEYQHCLKQVYKTVEQHFKKQCPKAWLGIGQSTGAAILLDYSIRTHIKRQNPMFERLLLLSPLVRPAKSAWWHNSVGLSLIKKIKSDVPRAFRRNNHNPEFLRFVRKLDPLQPRTMGMDWILAVTRWVEWMENQPKSRMLVWVAQGAKDQTVDWMYNIQFIRDHFRLHSYLLLEEGSHQLINERQDIRAALTAIVPAFIQFKE